MTHLYYDKYSRPIDTDEMIRLMGDGNKEYSHVGLWVNWSGEEFVSTVWLGINSAMFSESPMIFETLVRTNSQNDVVERYSTLEHAIAGHKKWVALHGGDPEAPDATRERLQEVWF